MWREAIDEIHKPVTAPSLKVLNFAGKYNHMCLVFRNVLSRFEPIEIFVSEGRDTVWHVPRQCGGDLISSQELEHGEAAGYGVFGVQGNRSKRIAYRTLSRVIADAKKSNRFA